MALGGALLAGLEISPADRELIILQVGDPALADLAPVLRTMLNPGRAGNAGYHRLTTVTSEGAIPWR